MSELQVDSRELEEVVLVYPRGFLNAHTVRLFETEDLYVDYAGEQ